MQAINIQTIKQSQVLLVQGGMGRQMSQGSLSPTPYSMEVLTCRNNDTTMGTARPPEIMVIILRHNSRQLYLTYPK
eukprot:1775708-Ditylum_brightwellii.AAC.1